MDAIFPRKQVMTRNLLRRPRSELPLTEHPHASYGTTPQLPVSRSRRRSHLLRSLLSAQAPPSTLPLVSRGANGVSTPLTRVGTLTTSPPPLSLYSSCAEEDVLELYKLVRYDEHSVEEETFADFASLEKALEESSDAGQTVWLSILGNVTPESHDYLSNKGVPSRVFQNATIGISRAKLEVFPSVVELIAHVPLIGSPEQGYGLSAVQVSLVMIPDHRMVVSFMRGVDSHAWQGNVMEVLRADIGSVRARHVAHLVGTMLDAMLETYFIALEYIGDILDELEWNVLHDGDTEDAKTDGDNCDAEESILKALRPRDVLRLITRAKHELGLLRRQVWPLRECLTRLAVAPDALMDTEARLRVRESLDRTMQVLDVMEAYRDVGHSLLDLHLAAQNNRMQEVMQTLAVVTTIFVPLTFLAGIEGMNFKNQPELYGKWSYGFFWVLVCFILGGQVVFFRKKGWI